MKNESNPTNKISYDDIIERSIISSAKIPECGACKKSVFITDTPPTTWPFFCIQCGSWYHQKCVEQTAPSGSATICPKCKTGDYVKKATFYCEKCRRSTIKEKTNWPKMLCSKCGNEGVVAILTDLPPWTGQVLMRVQHG